LCRVEDCGKEFAKSETRTALLALALSCRTDAHCISVCRAIRNLTLSTSGQRLFAHVEIREGFLFMASCISSDDGREAWARAICRLDPKSWKCIFTVLNAYCNFYSPSPSHPLNFCLTSDCSIAYIVEGKRVFSSPSICTALVNLSNGISSDAAAEWISRAINRYLPHLCLEPCSFDGRPYNA
jgi:hypothetical protein